jgi:hypothetical protein
MMIKPMAEPGSSPVAIFLARTPPRSLNRNILKVSKQRIGVAQYVSRQPPNHILAATSIEANAGRVLNSMASM